MQIKGINIFITRKIPQAGILLLKEKGYSVRVYQGSAIPSKEKILREVVTADALIPLLSDNIDLTHAQKRNIIVTNTPDVLTNATADLTWALILSVSKRIVEADQFTRAGKFKGWGPLLLPGADVTGKTLGIIGAGRIGQTVAKRAQGFEMNILYTSIKRKIDFEEQYGAEKVELKELLSRSDFVSLHCPLVKDTTHLINADTIKYMKKETILINTARGPVVDEKILAGALAERRIAGAGLDVYEFEPQITKELLKLDNVIVLPHIGSATLSTRSEMAMITARNVISVFETGKAINPVY